MNTAVFCQLRLSALKLHIALVGPEEMRNFGFLTSKGGPTQEKRIIFVTMPGMYTVKSLGFLFDSGSTDTLIVMCCPSGFKGEGMKSHPFLCPKGSG